MNTSERLARIERKREAILADLAPLDPSRLTARPSPDKWSIREIVEHLVLAERDVVGDFSRLAALDAQPRGLDNHVRYLIVMCVLRFRIPVKAPSTAMLPSGTRAMAELSETWGEQHRRLRQFVAGLDRTGTRRAIFRHPVAGPLSVAQAVAMLEAHLDSHISQIRRLVR